MASRDYYANLSLSLSQVMDDVGVHEEDRKSRRRVFLIRENLQTLTEQLCRDGCRCYIFGSQIEGTTTDGLDSDIDLLNELKDFNLIQYLNDWVPGKVNLLLIKNEKFPGYCKLQVLKRNMPYPEDELKCDKFTIFDEDGRVILLNHDHKEGVERHGPAVLIYSGEGSQPCDSVKAIRCKTWPNGYKRSSTHPRKSNWPTPKMISDMENSGCFVVGVAHRLDEKKSESWRISTSLAERCLMFSLNITQIRCYTLIKMIVKTFIDPVIPDVISSYICKNLLFHCVENTRPDFWQETNLLRCVNQILLILLETIRCMNCPSFFNISINLLLGRVNKDNQVALMGVIWKVLVSEGGFLHEIRFDNINELIHNFFETIYQRNDCSRVKRCKDSHTLQHDVRIYEWLGIIIQGLMFTERFSQLDFIDILNTIFLFALQGPVHGVSVTLLLPFIKSHLATLKANEHILNGERLSSTTSLLYEQSLDSDVMSSLLKFASYLYCTCQFERAKSVLAKVQHCYADGFLAVCSCGNRKGGCNFYFKMHKLRSKDLLLPSRVSMCVMFSQAERRCCPRELQYEMFRSTGQEKLQKDKYGLDRWMELACTTSFSYLYFLWYMVNRQLGDRALRLNDLKELEKRASVKMYHRETVYNLLGQCYEYENKFDEAFVCYCKSLSVRPTKNAARWHIVLLLNRVYQNE